MKNNVGILIFGDPTRGGTIASEVKFLKSLYESNNEDSDFYIITVNDSVTKKIIKEKETTYDFPHEIIQIFGESDLYKLNNFSCLVTYPGHSNFFGGYLNDNIVKMYKIISRFTNDLKRPVFVRINDSEIKVRDYRKLSKQRLDSGYKAREEGKPDSAFMRDPLNVEKAEDLVSWKEWDYSLIYWFANGSKESCDWVSETMYDREDEYFRMANKQTFVNNSIYVSDDIFFLVRKNYERLRHRYEDSKEERESLDKIIAVHNNPDSVSEFMLKQYLDRKEKEFPNKFCYIGFFDTVNMARAKAFNVLFKENTYKVPLKIFGKGTEILTKFKDKTNVEIEEGFIKGDSEEYFDFLNKHLGYIFIGKGQAESRYIGKTVYDAIVARTPVVVYKKCDSRMITFENSDFYFENEKELNDIFTKLQNPQVREQWISEQYEDIMRKLPPSNFRFRNYGITLPEITEELYFKGYPQKEKEVKAKPTVKSTSLF
jgi:hypothetical protein